MVQAFLGTYAVTHWHFMVMQWHGPNLTSWEWKTEPVLWKQVIRTNKAPAPMSLCFFWWRRGLCVSMDRQRQGYRNQFGFRETPELSVLRKTICPSFKASSGACFIEYLDWNMVRMRIFHGDNKWLWSCLCKGIKYHLWFVDLSPSPVVFVFALMMCFV